MRLLRELDVKRPRHYSNSAAVVAVDLQSVESRVLERKLFFLQWVLGYGFSCVNGRAVEALSNNISNSCLMKECEELEEFCGISFTIGTFLMVIGGVGKGFTGEAEKS